VCAINRQAPKNWATNQYSACAKSESLEDVRTPANTTIQIHLTTPRDGLNNLGQRLDARNCTIELATSMVGDDDARDAAFKRQQCIFGSQNTLNQNGQPALGM
jgi:hypothetical protein